MRSRLLSTLCLCLALVCLALWPALAARADGPTDPPDKGGTRPEALTLPDGPGSLQGLGEQVNAEPATGALTLSLPVVVPPGPAAVTPDVGLHYDSRQGNGPLGIGWAMGLPSLQRRTDLGLPHYDSTDQLLWNGERLIEVQTGVYRPRVEGQFVRVTALSIGFRVDLKNGTHLFLGTSLASQVGEDGRVFRYLPDHALSVHGDVADYLYTADGPQRYVTEIDYGRAGAPPARVTFRYEARPDPLPDARAGFVIPNAQRLAEIDTFVDGDPGRAVRAVTLGYDGSTGLSRLSSALTCSGDRSACLPALSFTESTPQLSTATAVSLTPPGVWLGDPNTQLLDADGDGLPDVLQLTTTSATLWQNLGTGFAAGVAVAGAPGIDLSSPEAALQDLDGNGQAELLFGLGASGEDGFVYAPLQLAGSAAAVAAPLPVTFEGQVVPSGPDVRWLDLDGDGKSDVLQATPDGWTAWLNLGGGQLGPPLLLTAPEAGLSFEDHTLRLADMNGDGLVDLIQLQSGVANVFLNLGFGNFAPPVALGGAPDVGGDDTRLYLGDADGDGLADVFYVAPGRVSIWRNLGGLQFGPEIDVTNAPTYDPVSTTVRIADLLGNGVKGIVYSGGQAGAAFLWFLDPTAGVRPNLIVTVSNGIGGQRSVSYTSSGALEIAAAQGGAPFDTFAPFPVQVVTALVESDGVSPPMQGTHAYRDPYWDPAERRFEGFAQAQTNQTGDAHADGLSTLQMLHTGQAEDLSLVGHATVVEQRSSTGALLQRTRTTWVAQPVATGLDGEPSAFAAAAETDVEQWEGTSTPKVSRTRRVFDSHANTLVEHDDGWVSTGTADPEASTITSSFADDEAPWVLNKLAEQTVVDIAGNLLAHQQHFYDGPALQGLPLGALTLGDEMRVATWVAGSTLSNTRQNARDAYGNVIASLDGEGRRTELDFDQTHHLFPAEERHFPSALLTLRFDVVVDSATGEALSYAEADGVTTIYGYDGLGRLTSVARPTDLPGQPGDLRQYVLTPNQRELIRTRQSQPGGAFDLVDVQVFDGLLRPVATAQLAEQPGQYAISKRVERDARGNASVTFVPYFAASPEAAPTGAADTQDFRDALGRTATRLLPAGGELRWQYAPGQVTSQDSLASAGVAESELSTLDWRGKTASVIRDPGGANARTFTFVRDALGRVVQRTTPLGAQATTAYDGLGRAVAIDDPDAHQSTSTWDLTGNLLTRTDPRGTLAFTYDGAGRVLAQTDGEGTIASYCYDQGTACGGSDALGRLLSVTDRSGSTAFQYDLDGRLAAETVAQGGRALTTDFGFDSADRLSAVTYPDGQAVGFQLSPRGLVTLIPGLLAQATYTASGLPLDRTFDNGLSVQVTRDVADREIGVQGAVGDASVVGATWELLTSGAPSQKADAQGVTTYTLDAAERLTAETGPFGERLQTFDAEDRLTGRWSPTGSSALPGQDLPYASPTSHAVEESAQGAITYDAAGARVAEGDRLLTWNQEGQLTAVTSPTATAAYVYGFDGSRRSRTAQFADGRISRTQDYGGLVEVRDGVLWKHIILRGERIATFLGGELPAVHE